MITEAQLEARKLGIGGSDMPIILGLSSYKTPYQLYMEKLGLVLSSTDETPAQYWGTQLEHIVRNEFAKRNNVRIDLPETFIHSEYTFLRGNVDGFISAWNAVLEIKCSSGFMAHQWGEDGTDIIPLQYLVQVAHYCAVAEAECAYIAVLIGGNDYRQYKYTRDLALEARLIDEAKLFWMCVETQMPPEPINQVDLRLMYPKHNPDKTKTIAPEVEQQLIAMLDIRNKKKRLEEAEDKTKFNIMQYMEDAECLTDSEGRPLVTWKSSKRGTRTFLLKGAN